MIRFNLMWKHPSAYILCTYAKLNRIIKIICSLPLSWIQIIYLEGSYCSMCTQNQGAFLGNSTIGTSPWQWWCHATIEELCGLMPGKQQRNNVTRHTMPCWQQRNCCKQCFLRSARRLYKESLLWAWVSSESSCRRELELNWSEWVERWQLVTSAWELTAEGKYRLKPAVRGWNEMVTSLRGCEPGSSGTSTVGSCRQAMLVKTVKSLV
jgi:hypothetical protein